MSQRTIKPAREGLIVRRPENGTPLRIEGEAVDWSAYWQRRLNDGDVVFVVPKSAQTKQEKPQATELPSTPAKKGGAN